MKRFPWASLATLVLMLCLGGIGSEGWLAAIPAVIMVGLPLDAYLRSKRAGIAISWFLVPLVTLYAGMEVAVGLQDPAGLLYVPWFPKTSGMEGMVLGYALGVAVCLAGEWVETRSDRSPTTLPLQVLAWGIVLWFTICAVLTPNGSTVQPYLVPMIALIVLWLIVRIFREMLRLNPTRQRIESDVQRRSQSQVAIAEGSGHPAARGFE